MSTSLAGPSGLRTTAGGHVGKGVRMEVYYRELRAMSSRERKQTCREMEGVVAARRPSFIGRLWATVRRLVMRPGAPR